MCKSSAMRIVLSLACLAFIGSARRLQIAAHEEQDLHCDGAVFLSDFSMPGLISCIRAAARVSLRYLVPVGVAAGTWRLGVFLRRVAFFIRRVKSYRDSAKAAAEEAAGFQIEGARSTLKALKWFVIDDQVMGGRSQSKITPLKNGMIEFAGNINTTGGGFSSCRTLGDDESLGFAGDSEFVEVTALADSRQYKLTLHMADSWAMSVPTWAHDFHAGKPGQIQTWRLYFKDFVPSRQGQPLTMTALDPSSITGVGINLSLYTMHGKPNPHFGDGPFKITLHSLAVH